ncbi:hypothetical protein JXB02_04020 [Candidatus Woesearchaeota archaeon]|nr:hypothetical protein [Candidatus Woesearchaeota archaeon]
MQQRRVSSEKYVIAGVITLGIFLLGLFLGLVIEGKRVVYIQSMAREQKLDFSSLQLQYAYMDQLSQEDNCPRVTKAFEDSIESLEETRLRLESYNQNAQINKYDFTVLQREYIQAQINYWLLSKRTRATCNTSVATVLYFYGTKQQCPDCEEQAFILTYLKKRLKERLLVFAFDANNEDEPMIDILKKTYNFQVYPTVVVEDTIFTGLTPMDDILIGICPFYDETVEDCAGFFAATSADGE